MEERGLDSYGPRLDRNEIKTNCLEQRIFTVEKCKTLKLEILFFLLRILTVHQR